MPIRNLFYKHHGITRQTCKEEWYHFPVLSSGPGKHIGRSGAERRVILHLEGHNLLNIVRSFPQLDGSKINSFTTNRHAQVTCAWKAGVAGELVFGHSRKTAESTYVETTESDRTGANEKRGEAMEDQGVIRPTGLEDINPNFEKEDYREYLLDVEKEKETKKKRAQLRHNPIKTKRRNDVLALSLGAHVLCSWDPEGSRALTNAEFFPLVKHRAEFILNFVSNPRFDKLQEEIIFSMSKFKEHELQDKQNYGAKLWQVIKGIMKRGRHFYVYEVSLV